MRILFVGNSHTYANGLPFQVRAMVEHGLGPGSCDVAMVAPGGQPLAWHAGEPGSTLSIRCGWWDWVVLQQATHPFAGYEQLAADYAGLAPHIEGGGARAMLYMTWARKVRPHQQAEIDAAFERLAGERGLALARVSRAWVRALAERPDIQLYQDDGSHASPAGSYVAACVFFATLTGQSPVGLPARIVEAGQVLAHLPTDAAEALQRFAADAATPPQ